MADSAGDKKHEATEYRRRKAREEGNVVRSADLGSATLLLVGVVLLDVTGPNMMEALSVVLRDQLGAPFDWATDSRTWITRLLLVVTRSCWALAPLMAGVFLTSIVIHFVQVGPLWLPDKLAPDLQRINPLSGLQRIFSILNASRLGFGLIKIGMVVGILVIGVWSRWDAVLALGGATLETASRFVWETLIELCRNVAVGLLLLAIVDYAFQRWKYEQDLRMTDEELREEFKMTQGDPQTKARRRRVQRELANQRLQTDVPKADVVITNPTELAIALQYDPLTMKAPIVLAKGADLVAARIRKIALEHGIPIVERKPLAQALFRDVDIGKPVPVTEYAAVAEVLKYVYQVQGRKLPDLDTIKRGSPQSQ
ncbi:MAG: flagellar biosynthesis protein FlhB [Planctomycetota bacterium]|jgi:flagellar biosynthetic protein FlhB